MDAGSHADEILDKYMYIKKSHSRTFQNLSGYHNIALDIRSHVLTTRNEQPVLYTTGCNTYTFSYTPRAVVIDNNLPVYNHSFHPMFPTDWVMEHAMVIVSPLCCEGV